MTGHESEAELTAHTKAVKRLDRRLNRTLHLPRRTEHEWSLATLPDRPESWENFYAGRLGQVALTKLDENIVLGQLRWPAQTASFNNPPAFRPEAFFRLVGFPTTPEELAAHRHDYPGFIDIGMPFSNLETYNQLVAQFTLPDTE